MLPNGTYPIGSALPQVDEQLTIDDLTVRNSATATGGAVLSNNSAALTLRRVAIVDSRITAISTLVSGVLAVEDSTIARNTSAFVGGIASLGGSGFTGLVVRRSTIADNVALDTNESTPLALAGGILAGCLTVSLLARTRKATLARVGDLVLAQGALKLGSGTRSIRLKGRSPAGRRTREALHRDLGRDRKRRGGEPADRAPFGQGALAERSDVGSRAAGHIFPGRCSGSEAGVTPALSRNCDSPDGG